MMVFSSVRKRRGLATPVGSRPAGTSINLSTWLGAGTSALMARPSSPRFNLSAMASPRLGMNGNGCAGSTANGVSNGNTRCMKIGNSAARSVGLNSSGSITAMPWVRKSARSARQRSCCLAISAAAASWTLASCSAGVSPSMLNTDAPCLTCSYRPATRTM